jgi:hypothetical protein
MEEISPPPKVEEPRFPVVGTNMGFQLAPLEELWKSAPKKSGRI